MFELLVCSAISIIILRALNDYPPLFNIVLVCVLYLFIRNVIEILQDYYMRKNPTKTTLNRIAKPVRKYTKYLDSYLPRKGKSAVFPVDIDNVRDLFDALNNKAKTGIEAEEAVSDFTVVIRNKFVDLRDIHGFVCTDGLFTIQYGNTPEEPFVCRLFNARIFTDDEKGKVEAAIRLFDSKYAHMWASKSLEHKDMVPLNHFRKYYLSGDTNVENIFGNNDPNLYYNRMNIKIERV